MSLLVELSKLLENNVKAYKLTVPSDVTESDLWNWVEDQEVVTIEDIKKEGSTLYVYPHFGDKYSDATLNKLKKSLSVFLSAAVAESAGRTKTHYDGGEFDADVDSMNHHLKQIRLIVQSPAMAHHIKDTLQNFDVDTKTEHRALENAVHALQQALDVFYHKMQEAE